jgi:uncharacterized protein YgiM (DUF1202 family)
MRRTLFGFIIVIITSLFFINSTFALCVTADTANLRPGPGTKYDPPSWQVFKYMPLKKLAKKGNWYKVQDIDGDTHWIFNKLVTSKFKCAVVMVDEANIRSGPGDNYKKTILSPLYQYESMKVLETKGDWVKILFESDDTGWIWKNLLWIQ